MKKRTLPLIFFSAMILAVPAWATVERTVLFEKFSNTG